MHPIFLSLGPLTIHTYGLMMAIGFLASLSVGKRLSLEDGLPVGRVLDLAFWCLVLGFLGARILFVITQWNAQFASEPMAMFRIWEGGLVFLGAPLAAVPFTFYYLKKYKMPVWRTLDVMSPGVVLGHFFGRLGCLASGCCYGRPTGTNFGIKLYSDIVEESHRGIYLHPTQLYEATGLAILFFGLLYLQRHKRVDGQIFLTHFISYSVLRGVVEIFRGDGVRGYVIEGILSTSQFLSIWIFLIAAGTLVWRVSHQAKLKTRPETGGAL
jgi:phosphatidylglycerol:prolipoprotein diacylglycerol transferase